MTLRDATPADVSDLFDIRCSVRENHMPREQLAQVGITPETVAAMISGGDYATVVLEESGAAIAFAMARVHDGYVFAVFVRGGWERRGNGSAVLVELENRLRQHGVQRASLSTGREAQRAHAFYCKHGWQSTGTLPDGQIRYEKGLG
jgi:ribosomal protein S18 acetylase RimI-like enzyme